MGTAGTAPDFPHTCARYNKVENDVSDDTDEEEQLTEGSDPYSPLPTFPQNYVWPELLERIISFGKNPEQRDILLLGAFTVLGASLSHIVRCQYGRKWQAPCMQTFIVAPSASGKSALTWVRLLIEPIHDKIRSEVKEAMKTYRREKAAYDSLGKERKNQEAPALPLNRMFLISGNNTGTGILQNIMDSNGTGLICESEADTVSTAIGTEYGNWSDTLRKAFDHDRLSYNRRTDREYQEVSRSYLSVLLSGTPAQVKPLIPTAENGLFSRQNFYYMPRVTQWADQFGEDEVDVDEEFRLMGNEWKNTLDELMGLTHDQKLKDEMMRQKREYRRFNQAAHTALDAIGAQAKGQSAAARMSVSMGIRTRTMMDKSTRNLAEMLTQGSGMGVVDCVKAQKDYPNAAPGTKRLAQRLMEFEEDNRVRLEQFL